MVQTEVLDSSAFNAGTEASFSLNLDQELPWRGRQIEYKIGAARFEDPNDISQSCRNVTFAWPLAAGPNAARV